jgi:hypothetical protein
MSEKKFPIKSLKMTAAMYAKRKEVVDYIREHGVLPEKINAGGFPAMFGHNLHTRGVDLELTEKEQMVYDAILRSGRTPGGMAQVIDELDLEDEEKSSGAH